MTDIELFKQTLDSLDNVVRGNCDGNESEVCEALRARLAQPEQEPVAQVNYNERQNIAWLFGKQLPDGTLLYTTPPQRKEEPEPVKFKIFKPTPPRGAEMLHSIHNDKLPWVYDQDPASGNVASMWVTPVYTAPPQREWVGLTESEIVELAGGGITRDERMIVRIIEAKLKEKNS